MMAFFAWFLPLVFCLATFVLGWMGCLQITGRKAELRDWLNWVNEWAGRFPSTNGKALAGIGLAYLFVVGVLLGGVAFDRWMPDALAITLAGFIAAFVGLTRLQFRDKRTTDRDFIEAQARARAAAGGTGA